MTVPAHILVSIDTATIASVADWLVVSGAESLEMTEKQFWVLAGLFKGPDEPPTTFRGRLISVIDMPDKIHERIFGRRADGS